MMKSKLTNTTEQDQGQHLVQGRAQNPALDHVQGLAQGPSLGQNLVPGLDPGVQEIDQGQGVEAVHENVVPALAVDLVHILGGDENLDPGLAVLITIGTKGMYMYFFSFLLWNVTVMYAKRRILCQCT